MNITTDYPITEAINDLENFLKSKIKNQDELTGFMKYLEQCKASQNLGFRYIHEELMKYRKTHSDYFSYSEAERKMIDKLFYYWG